MDMLQEQHQYLTFLLGQEVFAANILRIREIIEHSQLTQVPMMPAFIRGVINLRGRVVPVIDLQARFGKEPTEVNRRTCIVILETLTGDGQQDIGVMVDAVNEVLEIVTEDIEPAPNFGASLRNHFIKGMGKVAGKFVIILDVDRVLSVEEMAVLTEMSEEGADEENASI
jgi:purine-binding chemotaxis protein CheW